MAGVTYGGVDLESTYNFKVIGEGGYDFRPARMRINKVTIPGQDGDFYLGATLDVRPITVVGFMEGSSHSDLVTKLIGLDGELCGSFGTTPDANYIAPARALKTLVIPNFGTETFTNCQYQDTIRVDWPGGRFEIATWAVIGVVFLQMRPFTVG